MTQSQQRHYDKIATAIAYIRENLEQQPDLAEVAKQVHLSPYHFQRLFTEWAGVSPKKFLQYTTLSHAKSLLQQSQHSVLAASEKLGLSSSSRLHDLFINIEAMTPAEYKNAGANLHIDYDFINTPFGTALFANTKKGICHICFDNEQAAVNSLKNLFPNASVKQQRTDWQQLAANCFYASKIGSDNIKLHLKGTPFQLKVWEALLNIPAGQLNSYGDIATSIGNPAATRAVGTAIGRNPIAFLIPCHRVIRTSGALGGYRWGLDRKAAMIGWESSHVYKEN